MGEEEEEEGVEEGGGIEEGRASELGIAGTVQWNEAGTVSGATHCSLAPSFLSFSAPSTSAATVSVAVAAAVAMHECDCISNDEWNMLRQVSHMKREDASLLRELASSSPTLPFKLGVDEDGDGDAVGTGAAVDTIGSVDADSFVAGVCSGDCCRLLRFAKGGGTA